MRQFAQAAIREKRALVALREVPFVVAVIGLTLGGGRPGYLLELAEGGELFAGLQDGSQGGGVTLIKQGRGGGGANSQGAVASPSIQEALVVRRFGEDAVRFYAAELVVCLEGIHGQGYVYRDLKPENVVLTSRGHVRLVDLGLAEPGDRHGRVKGKVGTREFLSPEALMPQALELGITASVDWWALGCLLFELTTGQVPFAAGAASKHEAYLDIIQKPLRFPSYVSAQLRSFIASLLDRDYDSRLKTGNAARKHPLFAGIDWGDVRGGRIVPPVPPVPPMPQLKAPMVATRTGLYLATGGSSSSTRGLAGGADESGFAIPSPSGSSSRGVGIPGHASGSKGSRGSSRRVGASVPSSPSSVAPAARSMLPLGGGGLAAWSPAGSGLPLTSGAGGTGIGGEKHSGGGRGATRGSRLGGQGSSRRVVKVGGWADDGLAVDPVVLSEFV